ncbi:AI-2E family transporter [Thermoflavifilum thermophilum]|uniref:Predicted PurR-regulated permease PerM n=1 Tax=Thermoflavifilum thermophilum TaxID=1393122 RepID=A0A1I7NHE0_9BACT|nr:AI-2E family transporter [Thermoflavifilum thermophilum]SFV34072.1 Predicted PurR-regulated permease PerM [Thermoflavifilum thermophilum]
MNTSPLPFFVRLAAILLSIVLIGYLVYIGQPLLSPLLFAFLFSMMLLPVNRVLEKMHVPRSLAVLISIVLFIAVLLAVLYFVASQVRVMAGDWPALQQQLNITLQQLQEWLHQHLHMKIQSREDLIQIATQNISSSAIIGHTVVSVSTTLLFIIFVPIYMFLLLYYRRLLTRFLMQLFKEPHRPRVHATLRQIERVVKRYVLGLLMEIVAIAILLGSIFWILGIPYAWLLAVITAILNIIPYVGIYSSLVLCALITFASGSISKVLALVITMVAVHTFDANFLMPRIVGSQVKINVLITIIGVVIGEMMWGIAGMFLAIPTIAIMKIVFDQIESMQAWSTLLSDDTHPVQVKKIKLKNNRKQKQSVS